MAETNLSSKQEKKQESTMLENLLKLRYVSLIIVAFAFVHALGFIVVGSVRALRAYNHIIHLDLEARPAVEMLESLDSFFIALVFLIFSAGIAKLFILPESSEGKLPSWLHFNSFSELKVLLWETILTAMLVGLIPEFVGWLGKLENLNWTMLAMPLTVLLLALSLFLVRAKHQSPGSAVRD